MGPAQGAITLKNKMCPSTNEKNPKSSGKLYSSASQEKMPEEGLEPTLLAEPDPKSGASANFAIRACLRRGSFTLLPAASAKFAPPHASPYFENGSESPLRRMAVSL